MTHTDVGEAVVEATPAEVFAALVDEAARTADARPGGGYRMTLTYDDESTPGKSGGGTDVVEVRFLDLDAPHRLVEQAEFVSDDPDLAGTMTLTWSLEPVAEGTRVVITATDVPDGISSEDHAAAFASTLGDLRDHLDRERS
ncbi:SRPBCC domain-containing protein [Nocardioides sp. NPDC092400]|uniref:SRPBCC domain-containing protein n=1 Tax=Nocardioides sp. NPDC092400 TaxID=3155196 RepID=UPI00342C0BAF